MAVCLLTDASELWTWAWLDRELGDKLSPRSGASGATSVTWGTWHPSPDGLRIKRENMHSWVKSKALCKWEMARYLFIYLFLYLFLSPPVMKLWLLQAIFKQKCSGRGGAWDDENEYTEYCHWCHTTACWMEGLYSYVKTTLKKKKPSKHREICQIKISDTYDIAIFCRTVHDDGRWHTAGVSRKVGWEVFAKWKHKCYCLMQNSGFGICFPFLLTLSNITPTHEWLFWKAT